MPAVERFASRRRSSFHGRAAGRCRRGFSLRSSVAGPFHWRAWCRYMPGGFAKAQYEALKAVPHTVNTGSGSPAKNYHYRVARAAALTYRPRLRAYLANARRLIPAAMRCRSSPPAGGSRLAPVPRAHRNASTQVHPMQPPCCCDHGCGCRKRETSASS